MQQRPPISVSCAARGTREALELTLTVGSVADLKRQLAQHVKLPPWRIDLWRDGESLPSNATVADHGGDEMLHLEMSIRQGPKRSISIDAKLVNSISCDTLRASHIRNLCEELGGRRYEEVMLTVTDWNATMPEEITARLVEFLSSRKDDPKCPCLVHLDLHGNVTRLLEAMNQNRQYFESMGSSLEILELSVDVDDHILATFLPWFPNLNALRMYKPTFPTQGMTDCSIRLLNLNCQSLQDVAIVSFEDSNVFRHILQILSGENFDVALGSSTLWLVGSAAAVTFALRCLGDALHAVRAAGQESRQSNFLMRLGKLNIQVDDTGEEGFGEIRRTTSVALNRGLDEEQIARRPPVLTTIRSTRPALRPHDMLMCLFDVTALSLGVATARGTDLLESEAGRCHVLTVHVRHVGPEALNVECSNLAGDVVLSTDLHSQSVVADLENLLVSVSERWKGATFLLGDHQVSDQASLQNCDTLVVKEVKDAVMSSLIQRNTTIPTKKSKLFTGFEGQESFWIQVLEGELPVAKDNYVVGELRLDGLRPALGNRILVEVEFDIDANGILHVKASDLGSGSTCTATFSHDTRWRLSPGELEAVVRRAEESWKLKTAIQDRSEIFQHCSRSLLRQPHDETSAQRRKILAQMMDETEIADDYKAELQAVLNMGTADRPHIDEVD